ncbi:MAG: class I SAM-dependent methyltransferase [Chthoniobacteraceae bacterium]
MNETSVTNKIYRHSGNERAVELVPAAGGTVLDVGCGAGDNARLLKQRGKNVDGITLSPAEAEIARGVCDRVWLHNLEDGLPEEVTGPYDAVFCSHVIEHICFPQKLLRDIHRVLHPEGVVVVALPNMLFYKNRIRLMMGRIEYEEGGLMDYTHFRWYSFTSARQLFECNGFACVSAQAEGHIPAPGVRGLLPGPLIAPVDRFATRLLPGFFGHELLFKFRKSGSHG